MKFGVFVVEIDSESSLAEAVRVLAKHMLLSAPVVDAHAPKDASWVDRYIGVVEFAGIVVWILQQVSYLTKKCIKLFVLKISHC